MDMREQILASAQRLAQQRGFNGFSYADVADEVGIRKASLHHHFPTKTDLGLALVEDYCGKLESAFARIADEAPDADAKLAAYVDIYRGALQSNRGCLCGMLASQVVILDPAIRPKVNRFFARNIEWLSEVLAVGKSQGVLTFGGTAADQARMFVSAVQGALLMARATGDQEAFTLTTALLIAGLTKSG